MTRSTRHATFLMISAMLAAYSFAYASSAFASTPRLVVTMPDFNPVQYQSAIVDAKVLDRHGLAAHNVSVAFSWTIDGHVHSTATKTNAHGIAEGRYSIGGAMPWRLDGVALSSKLAGKTLRASVHFRPLPAISPGHPVAVRIGVAGPLAAGATALGQGMHRGAMLAIEEFDASSTVTSLGISFTGITADDQGDPKVAVAAAKHLVADPRLLGVEGHLNSGCSIPASKIYAADGVPMITPASTNPALTQQGLNNVFRTCSTDSWQGPKGAAIAIGLGYRAAYMVDDSTPYGTGLAKGFSSAFKADGGAIAGTAHTSDKDTNFTALVARIKSANPAVVYYGGIYNAGALFAKQLHNAGVTAPVMGGDGLYDPEYIALGGTAVNGDLATSIGYPADHLPNGASFVSAYNARFPGVVIGAYDAYAYDATKVMLSAIVAEARAQGGARVGLPQYHAETLARISATNVQGVTGPITFDAHGDRKQHDIAYYKVVGGYWSFRGVE